MCGSPRPRERIGERFWGVAMRCRFQLRCVLSQPLTVYPGAEVAGELRLVAHKRQSYDVHLRLSAPSLAPGVPDQTVCAPGGTCLPAQLGACMACVDLWADALVASFVETGAGASVRAAQVTGTFDLKEPYYRQLTSAWWPQGQQAQSAGPAPVSPGSL